MPHTADKMGLIHKPGVGPNNRFGFKNVGNNKANALEELSTFLESVSLAEGARKEQEVAESQQQVLNKAPLNIYIG